MHFLVLLSAVWMVITPAAAETFDSIGAVVNDEVISCYDIESDVSQLSRQMIAGGVTELPSLTEMRKQALNNQIDKLLQVQEAKNLEISVDDQEVNQTISNVESSNGLLPGQLAEALKQQGMDLEEYKKTLSEQILIGKVINAAVRSKVQPGDEALREYYRKYLADGKPRREVQLAQIVLTLPEEPTPAQIGKVRDKILSIRQQLDQGAGFEQMVSLYSESPDKSSGGITGWFRAGGIAQRFASALELPVGAVTDPIRSPSAFYLIKVMQERWVEPEATGESYDEVHARHILLQIPSSADDATASKIRQRAQQIAAEMQDATDEEFATRAKEESQGPSASKGGDLGWFRRGTMMQAFEDAAFALKSGETSGVVETGFGLHVIRMVSRRHIDPNSFEAHKDEIQQILINVEMQEQIPRWLASLKSRANIEIRPCDAISAQSSMPVTVKPAVSDAEIKGFVEAWRKAWAQKDMDAYFDFYAEAFDPGNQLTQAQWRDSRKRNIVDKSYIRIAISQMQISREGEQIKVQFVQDYEADKLKHHDRKMLVLEKGQKGLRIIREMTAALSR